VALIPAADKTAEVVHRSDGEIVVSLSSGFVFTVRVAVRRKSNR
jgi:hypothetical protein